ncbi:hypothetical protein RDV64_10350 [Acuticoccus sp. MNP-M23]|uniref:hypothetical protein n=1 Tax=Acuticoccus sp. MNP-M23 TaxID=3072793 RepID=UPI00281514F5|nr:hypothetical protein [Acuticoccus sp. MNP-M23]WMS44748.1 hypothetical protein RDV64_10350 [Acuticoccus sp. MNP-M23]
MSENEDEGELDPAMERVRRKLVRLLIVSSSIMILGFAAVVAGIFYRVSEMDSGPAAAVALEFGTADLIAVSAGDDQIVLTIGGANPRIEVRSVPEGTVLGLFTLRPDAAGRAGQ